MRVFDCQGLTVTGKGRKRARSLLVKILMIHRYSGSTLILRKSLDVANGCET